MTRDEVRVLIADAAYEFGDWQVSNLIADKVLAAFAARGIVIGVMEDIEVDIWPEDGEIPLPDGYALVRVVE